MKYLAAVAEGAGTELELVDLMVVDKVVLLLALLVVVGVAETVTGLVLVVATTAEVGLGTHWSGSWLAMVII